MRLPIIREDQNIIQVYNQEFIQENYVQAASDASKAIDVDASDVKALFRRCQALEKLGKLDQAFKDVQRCATLEPKNQTFQEILHRIGTDIHQKAGSIATSTHSLSQYTLHVQFSTDSRVQKMFEILLDPNTEKEKREKAVNNLIVLGREEAGAERIFQNNGVNLLLQLVATKDTELILSAVRTLSGMCTGHRARAAAILHLVGFDRICRIMAMDNEEIALATCNLVQNIVDSLTKEDRKEHGKEEALVLDTKKDLRMITTHLLDMLVSKNVSGHGRDQALNLLNKNIPRYDLKNKDNSKTLFVVDAGLKKILKVLSQIPELPNCLSLTVNTRLTASILLNKLYDDLRCDPERDNFRQICEEYITGQFDPKNMEKNLHAIQTVSGILQGPFDLGNKLLGLQGVMEMMVALTASENEVDQLIAVEALIHASTKLNRATFIITNGVSLLKDIYKKTKNEKKIKIRALVDIVPVYQIKGISKLVKLCLPKVQCFCDSLTSPPSERQGLCKLGSAGGTDYGLRQFAEGSTDKLAKQCRKWLCNPSIDIQTRKWAVEGLAYLTLDADVKDDFVEDEQALQAMFDMSKTSDKTILYSVASTLVNCTNSYDVKEDKKDFVTKRVKRLLQADIISALSCMVKADNAILTDQTKEQLARVFLALCEDPKDRGTIVAQGGGKAMIPLALEGTEVGKTKAAHGLAKIAAVSNPDIAFPGERIYEVVRPLVGLLNTEKDGMQNFEALLALTNLSGKSEKLRFVFPILDRLCFVFFLPLKLWVIRDLDGGMDVQGLFSRVDQLAARVQRIQDYVVQTSALEPRIPTPDLFYGDRSKFLNFKNNCKLFFALKPRSSGDPIQQVEVDASEIGAGAVLSQRNSDGSLMKPCAFFSQKFSPAECNYDVGNRELLAMKWAFKEWRHWLEGAKHRIVVLTDHKNLIYLESAKRLNPRQAWWSLFFSSFDFVELRMLKRMPSLGVFLPDSPGVLEPVGILREGVILSAISPDLRRALREFQADKPDRCPVGKLFVPDRWTRQVEPSDCPGVDSVMDRLQQIWTHVVDNLTLSQEKAQRFANRRRQKIIKEKALSDIENYMFENHEQIRQAATECMCNLSLNKEVQERFTADGNDRLKLVILLCGEEDEVKLQRAAAGTLAVLTGAQKQLCHKMTQVTTQWMEILQRLCLNEDLQVQHRGIVIAYNLICADQELAKKLVEAEMLEILTVIGKEENNPNKQHIIAVAKEALIKCLDYGLIKPVS
ncbi:unnamed protein product [Ranitomeya imitator]|uniref:Protein unc-45 homolog B n=1 Tax=Ranitomeya imitator TaxID=111125 RepID=A0ABN9KRZ2_9NEOB|nr:unnamed protein product [Ranitomeya imitator]